MDINDYMKRINYQPNSVHIPDYIQKGFEEEQRKEQLEKMKSEKIAQMQKDVEELKRQNIEQKKELKRQKIWNWITYGITTLIAIASVVGTFISIFR